jgi:hypothetical protein
MGIAQPFVKAIGVDELVLEIDEEEAYFGLFGRRFLLCRVAASD